MCVQVLQVEPTNKAARAYAARLQAALPMPHAQSGADMIAVLAQTDDADVIAKALNNLVILADRSGAAEGLVHAGVVPRIAGYIDAAARNPEDSETVRRCASVFVGLLDHEETGAAVLGALRDGGHLDQWAASPHPDVRLACARLVTNALQGPASDSALDYVVMVLRNGGAGVDTMLQALLGAATPDLVEAFMARGGLDALLTLATHDEYIMVAAAVAKLAQVGGASEAGLRAGLLTALQQALLGGEAKAVQGLRTAAVMMLAGALTAGWAVEDNTVGPVLGDLANSRDPDVQQGVAEVLAAAANHKACQPLVTRHADTIERLAASPKAGIAARALVARAKLSAADPQATDEQLAAVYSAVRPFFTSTDLVCAAGPRKKCKFAVCSRPDLWLPIQQVQRFAVEALAHLTANAEVKELVCAVSKGNVYGTEIRRNVQCLTVILWLQLVADSLCLDTLVDLCGTTGDRATAFALCAILENVTNSHDQAALSAEQEELLKLQHMAQAVSASKEHPKDDMAHVDARLKALAACEIISALAALAKVAAGTVADGALSRVLLTLASDSRFRGRMVQAGLHNVLLAYAQGHDDDKVQVRGAHALARIAIKSNPNTAFAGQKAYELVRPLLALMKASHELQQFEAVLALTNLAAMDDSRVRDAIVAQKGVEILQQLQTDDNPMIKRAATEALCNMLQAPAVFEAFTTGPRMQETAKHWLLLAGACKVIRVEHFHIAN